MNATAAVRLECFEIIEDFGDFPRNFVDRFLLIFAFL
jgi:hypothetical protein